MNKRFVRYAAAWAVLFALFQVIAFVSPGWEGQDKYTASFWIGYAMITVAFLGQLACGWIALKEEKARAVFYRLSLVRLSWGGLVASFLVGGACMLISWLPGWVGGIVCCCVLAVNAIAVIGASAAVDEVERIDRKVKRRTFFIRELTAEAEGLVARAKTAEEKAVCKKVYEALRYSDPVSSNELVVIEGKIKAQFAAFADGGNFDAAEKLLLLIAERNSMCKISK